MSATVYYNDMIPNNGYYVYSLPVADPTYVTTAPVQQPSIMTDYVDMNSLYGNYYSTTMVNPTAMYVPVYPSAGTNTTICSGCYPSPLYDNVMMTTVPMDNTNPSTGLPSTMEEPSNHNGSNDISVESNAMNMEEQIYVTSSSDGDCAKQDDAIRDGSSSCAPKKKVTYKSNILYKTILCKEYLANDGMCPREGRCQFAHGNNDLRNPCDHPLYKTSLCKQFVETNKCPRYTNCYHAHSLNELRIRKSKSKHWQKAIEAMVSDGHFPVVKQNGDDLYFTVPKDMFSQFFSNFKAQ